MLKLINNVDINKLKEIGLYPKYDENTGKINRFESKKRIIGLLDQKISKTIFYKSGSNYILDEKCSHDIQMEYIPDVEIIYELTKANLIKKI